MTTLRPTLRPILVSLVSLPLLAADLQVRDVRLEIGRGEVSGYDAEYRYTAGGGSVVPSGTYAQDEYEGDAPFSVSALYTRGSLDPVGFVWAAGVEYQGSSEEFDGETYDSDMIGGKFRAGIGWTPAPLWRIEATAEGHLGYMRVDDADLPSSGIPDRATADGTYSAIGIQVGAGYAFRGKWDVGVSFRAMRYDAQTEAKFDGTGGSYDADFSWVFLSAAVTGGYRF